MNKKKINYRIWPLGKLDKKFQRTEINSLKKKVINLRTLGMW